MSNIFDMSGRIMPTAQLEPVVNQELVGLLKELLAKAENAELLALAVVGYAVKPASYDLMFVMDGNTGPVHPHMMLGAMHHALTEFTNQMPGLLSPR